MEPFIILFVYNVGKFAGGIVSSQGARGGSMFLENFRRDAAYAFRTIRRDYGFALFAILIVGLGVGASCTIFSVVNTILIRPLPFRDPGRLVWMANHSDETNSMSGKTVQVDYLLDYRQKNQSFEDLAAYMAFYGTGDAKLIGDGLPERLTSIPVTQNFFPLLGVEPQIGRQFSAEECKWNGPRVAMLSDALWRRRFAADPHIVGRALAFDGGPVTVIGVLPASFDFGTIFAPGTKVDMYEPFPLSPETNRWGNTLAIVGRLKPGASVGTAQAEATILGKQLEQLHPKMNDFEPKLSMLAAHVSGRLRPALLVLACAVGVVMLIVCANLSNLLLARSAARQKEIAIRVALGAERRHLLGQILTESVLLSCSGAVLGVGLAFAGTRVLAQLSAMKIPLLADVRLDGRALGFTVLVAVATGLLFGLAPAWQATELTLHDALKDTTRGSSHGRGHAWVRSALVVAEISLACVLLAGAGLLIRSFLRVLDVNLGFVPERATALRVDPNDTYKTQEQKNAYFTEALHDVMNVQGIEAAGLSDALPLGWNRSWGFAAKGVQYKPGQYPEGFPRMISEGYFHAMGIPLRAGRDFTERDTKGALNVIILNETAARNLFPGQDPLGQIVLADGPERTVVGIVGDVRHMTLEEGSGNEFYIPMRQTQDYGVVDLVVRSSLPTGELASRLREALRPIEPNLPTSNLRTMQTVVDRAASPRRFVVILLGGFAGFALILASLGIYAVISYSVSQRRNEIGIRMALGASPGTVRQLILGETMRLAGIGAAIGLVGALLGARLAASLLYGVTATDPLTFAGMIAVLAAVAALAGYLPALRAARIEPVTLLRSE
ncbi:MAG TPA: ABC transporter permease [Candidatus Methylomirabilis sp.]|nr:ABC transporter permease [Candidatus Methylomirabilis sp.]